RLPCPHGGLEPWRIVVRDRLLTSQGSDVVAEDAEATQGHASGMGVRGRHAMGTLARARPWLVQRHGVECDAGQPLDVDGLPVLVVVEAVVGWGAVVGGVE